MAYSPQKGDSELSLSVFGGWVTNVAAAALPEGVSPDNQDVVYLPGSVSGRPAYQRVFTSPFGASIAYAKTFVLPTGSIENLYLDINGNLYWEDPIANPGILNLITSPLNSFPVSSLAKSVTAFGREYIAITDGFHGADVPVQWDGTHLDRVTQEGPAAPPTVEPVTLPSVNMAATGVPSAINIQSIVPAGGPVGGPYSYFVVNCSSSVAAVTPGDQVVISGASVGFYNATWAVSGTSLQFQQIFVTVFVPAGTASAGAAGTVTPAASWSMLRQDNIVTVNCAAAHNLQVGFQAQITGVTAATVGTSISSIVINNENLPSIATVTTGTPHGLEPGNFVVITGVNPVNYGSGIATASWSGSVVTITLNSVVTGNYLVPGTLVTIAGTGASGVNGTFPILQVISGTQFTYAFVALSAPTITLSSATATVNWPIPPSPTPLSYQVLAAPTTTTFQIQFFFSDVSFPAGGLVQFAWNGTFYVSAVLSSTEFQYQQYGPNATSTVLGTVTPYGQAAPGIHQCQVLFLTRQGHITTPSPPFQFQAAGGQYLSVSNIPIGPSNITGRILAFTGAGGSSFFYIPVPAQVNGQQISSATQINDNTTSGVFLDFSDPTLFAATAINIPGNNLPAQQVLDGALGFGLYAGRLITWGQRNRIQNMLGLSFDGGVNPNDPLMPLGWTAGSTDAGVTSKVVAGHFGNAWSINIAFAGQNFGQLSQSMFQDAYGNPIALPNTQYRFRCWFQMSPPNSVVSLSANISSASTSFSTGLSISGNNATAAGAWIDFAFPQATPATIPKDLLFTIFGVTSSGGPFTFLIDEISIYYFANPFTDTAMYGSYVNSPESFDGVTGKFGSIQDQHKVMDISDIRQTGYFLTQDPGGRLHQFIDNGVTEPAGWSIAQIATNCGMMSAFSLTKSQADDASASGGEEWFAWSSFIGARVFGGDQPWEISREIVQRWQALVTTPSNVWALNDPASRTLWFGNSTNILVLNYVGLDSAFAIGTTAPIRIAYSGKLIATDHSRKWTRWQRPFFGGALMARSQASLQPVFFGSNGLGGGNAYTLNPAKFTDDDFGLIVPYYTTCFLPDKDAEQALQLAGYRKLLVYVWAYISGVGQITVFPFVDSLSNQWINGFTRTLVAAPAADIEGAGGNAYGNRIALRFSSSPTSGTDNTFSLSRVSAAVRKVAHLPVRGVA